MNRLLRPPLQARGPLLNLYQPKAGDGCVLWLPGQDDAYSSTIRDRSGYGNHGTITGATWVRNSKGLWYLLFNGSSDNVNCGADSSFDITTAITLEAWGYPTAYQDNDRLIYKRDVYHISLSYGVDAQFGLYIDGGWRYVTVVDTTLKDAWYHIRGTYDSTSKVMRLYNNDVEIGTTTLSGLNAYTITTSGNPVFTGARYASNQPFTGGIVLPRIFNQFATSNYNQERHLFGG